MEGGNGVDGMGAGRKSYGPLTFFLSMPLQGGVGNFMKTQIILCLYNTYIHCYDKRQQSKILQVGAKIQGWASELLPAPAPLPSARPCLYPMFVM